MAAHFSPLIRPLLACALFALASGFAPPSAVGVRRSHLTTMKDWSKREVSPGDELAGRAHMCLYEHEQHLRARVFATCARARGRRRPGVVVHHAGEHLLKPWVGCG